MAEISLYARDDCGAPPAQRYSYKLDAPLAGLFSWDHHQENELVQRVKEAREVGMSYGCYMAMRHEREKTNK